MLNNVPERTPYLYVGSPSNLCSTSVDHYHIVFLRIS